MSGGLGSLALDFSSFHYVMIKSAFMCLSELGWRFVQRVLVYVMYVPNADGQEIHDSSYVLAVHLYEKIIDRWYPNHT